MMHDQILGGRGRCVVQYQILKGRRQMVNYQVLKGEEQMSDASSNSGGRKHMCDTLSNTCREGAYV